eukprot:TRINITY_DN419_c0_g2_i2.p1 TRINITY_DN419_c0_g2~~TRINITY_DN419_c0_g2_i2.p1  ORF type:complete len:341 (+),score=62.29 TRINITY_DN419_c0_g2_i2:72-1094(+)
MGCCGSTPKPSPSKNEHEEPEKGTNEEEHSQSKGNEQGEQSSEALSVLEGINDVYEFGKEIGRGQFSIVREGTKRENGTNFAIKCITKQTVAELDLLECLKREIKIMKKLNHPNIVRLFEVYEEKLEFFLVMELVEGKELFERIIERGSYTEKDASHCVSQIVSAIHFMHNFGIAHRDLKPENIMSSWTGTQETIKITDFGLAKEFGSSKLETACGTEGYIAPEVLTEETYGPACDMWSLGVIIFVVLSGTQPFYGNNPKEVLERIKKVDYDFSDPSWQFVSEDAKSLIKNLLVRDPQKRITAGECMEHPWVKGLTCGTVALATSSKLKDTYHGGVKKGN